MIRFPRMHIAESVTNRILNAANGIQAAGSAPPSIPPFNMQGAMLDQALAQPPSDQMASVEGIEDAIVGKAIDL